MGHVRRGRRGRAWEEGGIGKAGIKEVSTTQLT